MRRKKQWAKCKQKYNCIYIYKNYVFNNEFPSNIFQLMTSFFTQTNVLFCHLYLK